MNLESNTDRHGMDFVYVQLGPSITDIVVDSIHTQEEARNARVRELRASLRKMNENARRIGVWHEPYWKPYSLRETVPQGDYMPKANDTPFVVMIYTGTDYYDGNHNGHVLAAMETLKQAQAFKEQYTQAHTMTDLWITQVKSVDPSLSGNELRGFFRLEEVAKEFDLDMKLCAQT